MKDSGFYDTMRYGCVESFIMSKWLEEKAERNRLSVARLTKALPGYLPTGRLVSGSLPAVRASDTAARNQFVSGRAPISC